MSRIPLRIAPLMIPILLLGCFSTHLIDQEPRDDLQRLVQSSHYTLPLVVTNPQSHSSHGYQFVLGIFPLTRIFTDTISETVTAKLQLHAGRAAIGLTTPKLTPTDLPRLEVVITSVSINGYDLLVVRRPSAHITLQGVLLTPDGNSRSCEVMGEHTETTRFAFSPQLNQVLASAVDSAAEKLIACLGWSHSDSSVNVGDSILTGQNGYI